LKVPPLRNDWAAWQFDGAVLWAGTAIEYALNEREEYGPANARQSRAKYSIAQVLEPDFKLSAANGSNQGLSGASQ
jgi:hypothetical protein